LTNFAKRTTVYQKGLSAAEIGKGKRFAKKKGKKIITATNDQKVSQIGDLVGTKFQSINQAEGGRRDDSRIEERWTSKKERSLSANPKNVTTFDFYQNPVLKGEYVQSSSAYKQQNEKLVLSQKVRLEREV